ncbi:MAG: hypothetical protein IT290_08270 [Deltaproteobacteria bacterium]|nr:hypothetical protein [Deltaproteobacteria bacterium]
MSGEPEYLEQSHTTGGFRTEFYIPDTLCYLAGHFPDAPLVPAFAQIQWVIESLRLHFDEPCRSWSIERVKFVAPLFPSRTYQMEIARDGATPRFQFRISDATNVCTTGSLRTSPQN